MNIRKLIREQIGNILNEEMPISEPVITGLEVLNHFPFNKLPETRNDVDWSNRGVSNWGDVHVPSLDGNGLTQMFGKDDVIDYVNQFNKKFGEEPNFKLDASAPWFGKIKVLNEPYIKSKELTDKAIKSFGTEGD